jgi:hypothetical protein
VDDPLRDFRNFLFLVWQHLGLPEPTEAQYEIAYFMQHGFPEGYSPVRGRADIVEAFRGVGKSFIAAAFALWLLWCDPVNEKILVVSASSIKAKEFVSQCKAILMTMELLEHLRPRTDQRDAFDRFDVNGASISQSPSLKAAGITGQITGSRATRIIADDIEIESNSKTEEARVTLLNAVLEFESIKVPALQDPSGDLVRPAGDVLFLGTPQTAESIYNKLIKERGYSCFCIPARYPSPDKLANYVIKRDDGTTVNILAPYLWARIEGFRGSPAAHFRPLSERGVYTTIAEEQGTPRQLPGTTLTWGSPTDPKRFSNEDLEGREAKGRAYFLLQFMLDTTLSDADRYPLKQFDLTVFPCTAPKGPMTIQWGRHSDRINVRDDIPNVGFTGDYLMGPLFADKEWREWQASVLFVDPAGRGKDETAWAIVRALNGTLFVSRVGAYRGTVREAYELIAKDAKTFNVNLILIEPNFAPGVWIAGFQPVLARVWPGLKGDVGGCTVEEAEWAKGQKEVRIIDTLEPVMNTHRLVVDEEVAKDDVLMYQLTHITRDRGALTHDDRVDALAGAVSYMQNHLEADTAKAAAEMMTDEHEKMLEDFVEGLTSPRPWTRGRRRRKGYPDQEIEVYQS